MTTRLIFLAVLLVGCGNAGSGSSPPPPLETPTDPAPSTDPEPANNPPSETPPLAEAAIAPWLAELLGLTSPPAASAPAPDAIDEAMGRLGASSACASALTEQSDTCMVQHEIEGEPCQLHFTFTEEPRRLVHASVWGPTDTDTMAAWVDRVERRIDAQFIGTSGPLGTRPDRRWRNEASLLLLHDHSELPCGGLCPATLWVARSDDPEAARQGFSAE